MADHKEIYKEHAEQYDRLVSREDCESNIYRALEQIQDPHALDVVELGAGTGRLTCLLAPVAKAIRAFDLSAQMLEVAKTKLKRTGLSNWQLGVADHRQLPVKDRCADLAISGWSICYTVVWYPDRWQAELCRALHEMKRVVRPGGMLVLLETLGTGFEAPHAPVDLTGYYALLEASGFSSTWIRTDYAFASLEEAEALTRFFFGEEMLDEIRGEHPPVLPECTGIWWLPVGGG